MRTAWRSASGESAFRTSGECVVAMTWTPRVCVAASIASTNRCARVGCRPFSISSMSSSDPGGAVRSAISSPRKRSVPSERLRAGMRRPPLSTSTIITSPRSVVEKSMSTSSGAHSSVSQSTRSGGALLPTGRTAACGKLGVGHTLSADGSLRGTVRKRVRKGRQRDGAVTNGAPIPSKQAARALRPSERHVGRHHHPLSVPLVGRGAVREPRGEDHQTARLGSDADLVGP